MTSPQPIAIARAWRVIVRQQYLGRAVSNTLGYLADSAETTVEVADEVAFAVGDAWNSVVRLAQNAGVQVIETVAYSLQDPSVQGSYPIGALGGNGSVDNTLSSYVSSAIAANVNLLTGRRGRRYRGRTGMVGLLENQINGNALTTSDRSAIEIVFENFINDAKTGTGLAPVGELAVISETFGLATPVTAAVVRPTIGTRVARLR